MTTYKCGEIEGCLTLCGNDYYWGKTIPNEEISTLPDDRIKYLIDNGIIEKKGVAKPKNEKPPVEDPKMPKKDKK